MPLHMRIPKRGFNNIFAKDYAEVNVGAIQKAIDAGKLEAKGTIDHAALKAAGLARGGKDGVRLLGKGEPHRQARLPRRRRLGRRPQGGRGGRRLDRADRGGLRRRQGRRQEEQRQEAQGAAEA